MPAILLQYLPLLFKAAQNVPEILNYIHAVKTELSRKGEWTDEMNALYLDSLDKMGLDPAWQPHAFNPVPPVIAPPIP